MQILFREDVSSDSYILTLYKNICIPQLGDEENNIVLLFFPDVSWPQLRKILPHPIPFLLRLREVPCDIGPAIATHVPSSASPVTTAQENHELSLSD